MKIRILSPCYVAGKVRKVGDVIDVPEKNTRDVLGLKRAVKVAEEKLPDDPGGAEGGEKDKKKKGGESK